MSTRRSLALGAAGVVAGLALGATGLATAASSPSPSPSQEGAAPDERRGGGPFGKRGFGKGHPGGPGKHGLRGGGLVTAVDSDSLTISTPGGSETFALSGSTTYYEGEDTATRADVDKGDIVHVRVADPQATTKTAAVVRVLPAHLGGWVTAVGSSTITITDHGGFTRTIRTSSSTTYEKDGAAATRSAITVGSVVRAVGEVAEDGTTLDAERVMTGLPKRAPDERRRVEQGSVQEGAFVEGPAPLA